MKSFRFYILLLMAAVLAGCASRSQRAPVTDHSESTHSQHVPVTDHGESPQKSPVVVEEARKKVLPEKDWRPDAHVVQKGDTLYSIAFHYGLDYHELAELNGIKDPNLIQIGQQIRLFTSPTRPVVAIVEGKQPEPAIKEQPRLAKYAYSKESVKQIENIQEQNKHDIVVKPETKPKPEQKTEKAVDDGEDETLEWSMPTSGKLIGEFSESANRKGIDIAGKLGQPINASAPGKVVYSGSGLRGYGKLVIIKHNKTFLSAYAHNDQVLVKEGESVVRGQKIAEMGNTDTDQVKLHFEVRRLGKPVDPAKYLPLGKS